MFAFGIPKEQVDKMYMQHEEHMNIMHGLIEKLTSDELHVLMDTFAACKDDNFTAGYWVGQMESVRRARGFDALTQNEEEVMIPNSQPGERIQVPDPELGESEPKWVQGMLDLDQAEAGTSAENVEKNMELYGVTFFIQADGTSGVQCLNCGTKYATLEDRMRREPGAKGCTGCQNKAKWG